jgi:ribosomal protein L7/L12
MDFYTFASKVLKVNGFMSIADAITLFDALYGSEPEPKGLYQIVEETLEDADAAYGVGTYKIRSIKDVREATSRAGFNVGLKEARDMVENWVEGWNVDRPRP